MLPNYFPDTGTKPEYNNIDASLWFFDSVYQYWKYTGDKQTILELYPTLRTILTGYQGGTRYNIHEDTDGLISGGNKGIALTWMDARADDYPFTQRDGKAVEINALWYHALIIAGIVAEIADKPKEAALWQEKAFNVKKSFNNLFWSEEKGYLYDCISTEGEPDASLRPNQIFAVSLDHSALSKTRQASLVEKVMTNLLTPYGLRSLDPADERYQGIYRGDQWARDSAYHQGTVWSWLLGPFIKAYLRVNDQRPKSVKKAEDMLVPIWTHLKEAGLGNISEVFDGDFPHISNGCFAQAWSVATIVQAYYECILKRGPKEKK
jgi:predicted glycogen debranching enzyme